MHEETVVSPMDSVGVVIESPPMSSSFTMHRFRRRLSVAWSRLTLSEISGSLGDLGTFIPLYVALCRQGSLHGALILVFSLTKQFYQMISCWDANLHFFSPCARSTDSSRLCLSYNTLSLCDPDQPKHKKKNETASPALFFAGLCNVITGLVWDLPIPVQPMKSIAAVALVQALNPAQVTTAGIWMGIILTFVGVSNAIELVQGFIPPAVISGMQLGVGLSLAIKGMHVVSALPSLGQVDCQLLALVCSIGCILLLRERRSASTTATTPSQTSTTPPVGLYLFLLGAILSIGSLIQNPHEMANKDSSIRWSFQPWSIITWALKDASWTDWRIGLLDGALPQLPLSVLVRIFFFAYNVPHNSCHNEAFSRRCAGASISTEFRHFRMLLGGFTLSGAAGWYEKSNDLTPLGGVCLGRHHESVLVSAGSHAQLSRCRGFGGTTQVWRPLRYIRYFSRL